MVVEVSTWGHTVRLKGFRTCSSREV